MSLLNDLVGAAEGALAGAENTGTPTDGGMMALLPVVTQLIDKAGGLQGLLGLLNQHGLSEAAQSWVGNGANQAVSGGQLGQVLQNGGLLSVVQQAAGAMGTDHNALLGQLAQVLPTAINHLTPSGQAPAAHEGVDLGALAGLAGSLFS